MADRDETAQVLLDAIAKRAPDVQSEAGARQVLYLAEAYAWLLAPSQPHGGSVTAQA